MRANQAQLDLAGCPEQDYVGRSFAELIGEPAQAHELLTRLTAKEKIRNLPMTRRRTDGSMQHVLIDANSFLWDKRFHYFAIFMRDLTDRMNLEREILHISEREHLRIANDLHDGLGQLLVGGVYLAAALMEDFRARSFPETPRLARILEVLNEGVAQTRNLARGLHPVKAEANGLMVALEKLAERTTGLFPIRCTFKCRRPVFLEDNLVATHLFRIAQEAVTNAVKHAKPAIVEISLWQTLTLLNLAVMDDGRGMARGPTDGTGMGLRIMRYRAGMIGGSLSLRKGETGGLTVICSVPIVVAASSKATLQQGGKG